MKYFNLKHAKFATVASLIISISASAGPGDDELFPNNNIQPPFASTPRGTPRVLSTPSAPRRKREREDEAGRDRNQLVRARARLENDFEAIEILDGPRAFQAPVIQGVEELHPRRLFDGEEEEVLLADMDAEFLVQIRPAQLSATQVAAAALLILLQRVQANGYTPCGNQIGELGLNRFL